MPVTGELLHSVGTHADVADRILERAEELAAGAIVIGPESRHGVLAAPVAAAVAQHAEAHVIVLHRPPERSAVRFSQPPRSERLARAGHASADGVSALGSPGGVLPPAGERRVRGSDECCSFVTICRWFLSGCGRMMLAWNWHGHRGGRAILASCRRSTGWQAPAPTSISRYSRTAMSTSSLTSGIVSTGSK